MNPLAFSATRALGRCSQGACLVLLVCSLLGACDRNAAATATAVPVAKDEAAPGEPPITPPAEPARTEPTSATPLPATPSLPELVAPSEDLLILGVGEDAEIAAGTRLVFERIVSDSRCPAGVQCVWAGEVRIALTLRSPAGSNSFEMSERENQRTVQSWLVELVSFAACPASKAGAATGKECASLKVSAEA